MTSTIKHLDSMRVGGLYNYERIRSRGGASLKEILFNFANHLMKVMSQEEEYKELTLTRGGVEYVLPDQQGYRVGSGGSLFILDSDGHTLEVYAPHAWDSITHSDETIFSEFMHEDEVADLYTDEIGELPEYFDTKDREDLPLLMRFATVMVDLRVKYAEII